MMHKDVFTIDNSTSFIGYTDGTLWNGWATPHFELSEARKVMTDYNSYRDEDEQMTFDSAADRFIIPYDEYQYEEEKGYDIDTEDGMKHLYGIGAYSWIWDTYSAHEVATMLDEFIYEWDTYSYLDIFGFKDRDEVVQQLTEQLNAERIQAVIEILNGNDSAEEKIDQLAKIISL